MSISTEKIAELTKEYGKDKDDSGKSEVQIAILTERIRNITQHLKIYKKDHSTRRGLIKLVSRRRNLLKYLTSISAQRYGDIITKLNIRK